MDPRRTPTLARPALLAAALAATAARATAQVTSLQSVRTDGVQGERDCTAWDLSNDGRFLLFSSKSTLLVPGTLTAFEHAFVLDRTTGAIELVSVDSAGVEANADVTELRISADGNCVVFSTRADNLVADDTNHVGDCFLRDRAAGTTERVSLGPDAEQGVWESTRPVVSADGRYTLFTTATDNFDLNDSNGVRDVYLRDRVQWVTTLVSAATDGAPALGDSWSDDLSPDARFAVFTSMARDIVPGDPGWQKVFVRDLTTGVAEIASLAWDGAYVQADCWDGRCSADGNEVVFTSQNQAVVPNDSNQRTDIFLRDRAAATTARMNVGPAGEQDDKGADYGSISDDGRMVGFMSAATTLDRADTNTNADAYVRDRRRDWIARVSVSSDGQETAIGSEAAIVSPDGHAFLFASFGAELDADDGTALRDVFLHERAPTPAASRHYGAGFPGTLGTPAIALADEPYLGAPIDLAFSNTSGRWSFGFLVIGSAEIAVPGSWGGDLLATIDLLLPIPLPPAGWVLHDDLPYDASLWGVSVFLQAIQLDAGAARGLASTEGLELDLGS